MTAVAAVGDLSCYICQAPVRGVLYIDTFKTAAGRVITYGKCSVCHLFKRGVKDGTGDIACPAFYRQGWHCREFWGEGKCRRPKDSPPPK